MGAIKSSPGSWERRGASWEASWSVLGCRGASWEHLAASWGPLGVSWGVLGAAWDLLGASWGPLRASSEALRGLLGRLGWLLRASWGLLGGLAWLLGASWRPLATTWGPTSEFSKTSRSARRFKGKFGNSRSHLEASCRKLPGTRGIKEATTHTKLQHRRGEQLLKQVLPGTRWAQLFALAAGGAVLGRQRAPLVTD